MTTTTLDTSRALVENALADFLATHDPKTMDNVTFRGLRFDAGLAWVHFPVGRGGLGVRPDLNRLVEEGLRKAGAAPQDPATFFIALAGPTIATHGSDEVQKRFLRPMFTGQEKWCQLFSEPGAGSDFAGLGTRAVRDGDEWVVNGQKVWNTLAHLADWGMLVTRTDPDQPKHKGMTAFMVPFNAPGVEVRAIKQMSGGANFNEVFLTDVRIPDSLRLGPVGDGWKVALTCLGFERDHSSGSTSSHTGGTYKQVIAAAEWAGVANDPIIRQSLADLYIQHKVAQLTNRRAAAGLRAGQTPGPEGSLGKLMWTANMTRISNVISQILGTRLVADNGEWGTYAWNEHILGAPGYRIAGGSDEVQRNIVGERVLGLPPEPRVDKDVAFSEAQRLARK